MSCFYCTQSTEDRHEYIFTQGLSVWQHEYQYDDLLCFKCNEALAIIYPEIVQSYTNGTTFWNFRKIIEPIFIQKGIWDKTESDGNIWTKQRLQNIYDLNIRVATAQRNWREIQENKKETPYLVYTAVMDGRTNEAHLAMDGICRHVDDPFWEVYYPPCGWDCRCHTMQVDAVTAREFGNKILRKPHVFETVDVINPRTGKTESIPYGLDLGWSCEVNK
ncbi:MAG: phage minor head protein [Alphaproteobacteria bacterium]|nr:phage minor head protein [Alphaproteobacteria bacterium]